MASSDATTPDSTPQSVIDYRRTGDFLKRYANNVKFEPSVWDLNFVFGETDQQLGPMVVVQHTAMSLSWPQVKIVAYFLRAYLAAHEAQNGRIKIHPGIIPPVPEEIPEETPDPVEFKKAVDAMLKNYDEFVRENPEVLGPAKLSARPKI